MAKKKARTSGRKPKAAAGGGKSSETVTALSTIELEAELRRRQRGHQKLISRREKLLADLKKVDEEIRKSGGTVIPPGRKRPQNSQNLVDALLDLLRGKTMGVTEAAEAVQIAGYQTSAENFRTIVNQTLIKHPRKFKKVSRGQYTAA